MNSFNNGFTLTEVLISLVLISILLLGIDAMQIISLKKAKVNYYVAGAEQQIISLKEQLTTSRDYSTWDQQNQEMLPQGRGVVGEKQISIFWGNMDGQQCEKPQIQQDGCIGFDFT